MEHYGTKGGIFKDGRQLGAIRLWRLEQFTKPMFQGGTGGLNQHIFTGWKASARQYKFIEPPSGELEFRFVCKGSWYTAIGKIIGNPGVEGKDLKMEGTARPVSHKPKEKDND